MRVAAYQRVSISDMEQTASLELLKHTWEQRINRCRAWKCVGCYFDEGTDRSAFERLMEAAKSGQIDRIETDSAFDFIGDAEELIRVSATLKGLGTPVRVHFETEGVTTGTGTWDCCVAFLTGYMASVRGESGTADICAGSGGKEDAACRI